MRWEDIRSGDFVIVETYDHFALDDDARPLERADWPFRVRGEVLYIDSQKAIIEGAWDWLQDAEWEEPVLQTEYGKHGVVRVHGQVLRPLPPGWTP